MIGGGRAGWRWGRLLPAAALLLAWVPSPRPPASGPAPPRADGARAVPPRWRPGPGPVAWQWELDHPLDLGSRRDLGLGDRTAGGQPAASPTVYDLDGFDTPAATVAALHRRGARVICYIDVGTFEAWRPDAGRFPRADLGRSNGWPQERWLRITDPRLRPVMTARFAMCQRKGFDAVEPDNMDGATNRTGFALTIPQQVDYDLWVAAAVHRLGMAVAQKNFLGESAALEPHFDLAIVEQCVQDHSCAELRPYLDAPKLVLEAEYRGQGPALSRVCQQANALGLNTVRFDPSLDGGVRIPCRAG